MVSITLAFGTPVFLKQHIKCAPPSPTHHGGSSSGHIVSVIVAVSTEVHAASDASERSLLPVAQPTLHIVLLRRNLGGGGEAECSLKKYVLWMHQKFTQSKAMADCAIIK